MEVERKVYIWQDIWGEKTLHLGEETSPAQVSYGRKGFAPEHNQEENEFDGNTSSGEPHSG